MLETGQFLGMLSRDAILNGLRTEGGEVPIGRLVRTDCEPLEATMALDEALHRMRLGRHAALPVLGQNRLIGLLSLDNVSELVLVQEARQRHAGLS